MSTDVSKVYLFLAQQGGLLAADSNGDGYVIKSEFTNFMLNEFDGWDGETSDAGKNDLINSFWKTIDTNQCGKIKGTQLKNKNALDKNEISAANAKIEIYSALDSYLSKLTPPSELKGSAATKWKNSIKESLANYTDKYIGACGKNVSLDRAVTINGQSYENFEDYIEKITESVKRMTTADCYADICVTEDYEINSILEEYGYNYDKGTELYNIISRYINDIKDKQEIDESQIISDIKDIIVLYIQSAGLGEGLEPTENAENLKGYLPKMNENSHLNDLQKCVVQTRLSEALTDFAKNDTNFDYKEHKDLYDQAITSFINRKLRELTNSDYTNGNYVNEAEFKASAEYNKLQEDFENSPEYISGIKGKDAREYLDGNKFKEVLKSGLGEGVFNKLEEARQFGTASFYNDILKEAVEKAQNGEFDEAFDNKEIDYDAIGAWIVDQVKSNLDKLYANGLKDMSIDQMNEYYDTITSNSNDINLIRKTAIQYCDGIAAISSTFKQAVSDIFGTSWSNAINDMMPSEIDEKITKLKAKVNELGDARKLIGTDLGSFWGNVYDGCTVTTYGSQVKNNQQYSLNINSLKIDNITVTTDRIRVIPNNNYVTVDADGKITFNSNIPYGNYTTTLKITVDGIEIGSRTINIQNLGYKTNDDMKNEYDVKINLGKNGGDKSLHDILSSSTADVIDISGFNRNGSNSLADSKSKAISTITDILTVLAQDLISKNYDPTKINNALKTTINYYTAAIQAIQDQVFDKNGDGTKQYSSFDYTDANGKTIRVRNAEYMQQTHKYEKKTNSKGCAYMSNDSLGIKMCESYNHTNTYKFYLNVKVLVNKFMGFMNI